MAQDYSPSLVTKNLVFCGDAAMKSAAGPATLLYDKVNNNNGTMYNGSCLDFDGTDDHVAVGSSGMNASTTAITTSMWISFDGINDSWILANLSIADYTKGYLVRVDHPSSQVGFYVGTGSSSNSVWSTNTLSTSTWYHIVCTYKSGEQLIYVNGDVWASGTGTGSIDYTGITTGYIGTASDSSRDLDGQMANLMIYDTVLSAANVKELYDDSKVIIPTKNDASGGFVAQTNLKCWFPMSEGAGLVAYDGSGNSSDGTIVNASWLTGQTGAPQLVEGYNRPMTFDGASDYLKCGDVGNFTGSLSVSFWFYANTNGVSSRLIAKDMASGGAPRWLIYKSTSPSLILYFDDNVNTAAATSASFSTYETWHHFAATITSGEQKIYIDGASVGAVDTQTTSSFTTDNDLWIGRYASSSYFDGIINEVVLYDSVLTLAQVQVLAATGPNGGPLPPNPMSLSNSSDVTGYWRNDGNVTWADRSGNGYTGTVYGSPPSVLFKQGINGSKNVNTGRDGQGFPLKFKNVGALGMKLGVDDAVNFGSAPAFAQIANPGGATIGTWIRVDSASDLNGLMGPWIGTGNAGWGIFTNYSGGINMIVDDGADGSGYWVGQNTPKVVVPADGSFHYVLLTVVRNGVGSNASVSHYLDGVFYNTITFTNENGAAAWGSGGSTVFRLGNMSGGTNYFNGQIANMHMYNRVLTYAEIQQNYNSFKARFGE